MFLKGWSCEEKTSCSVDWPIRVADAVLSITRLRAGSHHDDAAREPQLISRTDLGWSFDLGTVEQRAVARSEVLDQPGFALPVQSGMLSREKSVSKHQFGCRRATDDQRFPLENLIERITMGRDHVKAEHRLSLPDEAACRRSFEVGSRVPRV